METMNDYASEEEAREEEDLTSDLWSDEGAKRFNEALDEGSAYLSAGVRLSEDFEAYCDEEQDEYLNPELYDPEEETLPPGEMGLIFENSYIM